MKIAPSSQVSRNGASRNLPNFDLEERISTPISIASSRLTNLSGLILLKSSQKDATEGEYLVWTSARMVSAQKSV
jgi:hypothetical protein